MFQLLSVSTVKCSAINRIFYFLKRLEVFESANITNLVLSILVSLKRPNRYSQNEELENCRTYNFLPFYVQFLLSFIYPQSAKLRTPRAKNVLACQRALHAQVHRALHAYVLTCQLASRANVLCVLTCSRANVPCVLTCSPAKVP